jgi:hypothetical protein
VIDIRIVCTHDALDDPVRSAETLTRLLEAEEHQVRLIYGRQSIAELESAKAARDAVLIIWSPDAPSQHYMLEWAHNIEPNRLVEVARAPGWPRIERKAPVIDFTTWRGERGSRAWLALNDRLRAVARELEPAKPPPKHAAMALGIAGLAAVGGAAVLRFNEGPAQLPGRGDETAPIVALVEENHTALGGPVVSIEPASIEDLEPIERISNPRFVPLELSTPDLVELAQYAPPELREPTLLERLRELNPLRAESPTPNAEDEA